MRVPPVRRSPYAPARLSQLASAGDSALGTGLAGRSSRPVPRASSAPCQRGRPRATSGRRCGGPVPIRADVTGRASLNESCAPPRGGPPRTGRCHLPHELRRHPRHPKDFLGQPPERAGKSRPLVVRPNAEVGRAWREERTGRLPVQELNRFVAGMSVAVRPVAQAVRSSERHQTTHRFGNATALILERCP